MRRLHLVAAMTFLLTLTACAHSTEATPTVPTAVPTSVSPGQRTICTQQNDTRYLEVKAKNDGNFDLLYTKFGTEKAVASGAKGYCQEVIKTIKSKLTASGFNCE